MAGYGLKAFLIAQSLNQIEKAYGANNSILDNCHVRVSFATNDERTAKRVSDALGTATEMKAMKNYAGHRLSPWLGHLMVSRQETARPLLTPGEVMQLPPADEIVMVAGTPPIRAKKARYYEDKRLTERVLPPPDPATVRPAGTDGRLVGARTRRRRPQCCSPKTRRRKGRRQWRLAPRARASRPCRDRQGDDRPEAARKNSPSSTMSRTMPPVRPASCASRCAALPARRRSTRRWYRAVRTDARPDECLFPAGDV